MSYCTGPECLEQTSAGSAGDYAKREKTRANRDCIFAESHREVVPSRALNDDSTKEVSTVSAQDRVYSAENNAFKLRPGKRNGDDDSNGSTEGNAGKQRHKVDPCGSVWKLVADVLSEG